jgi:hypothetical protein
MKARYLLIASALGLGIALALLGLLNGRQYAVAAAPTTGTRYVATTGDDFGNDCSSQSAPCRTIQHAVDEADHGETVKVAAGTYTDAHVRPRNDVTTTGVVTQVVYISKPITLRGGYSTTNWAMPDSVANPTTLDAEGQGRVVYVTGDIRSTVGGLRITGGNTAEAGGGVFAYRTQLTVEQTVISDNTAVDKGGGIAVRQAITTSVADCKIYANVSLEQEGGGVAVYDHSHMNLIRSWVVANASPTNDGGGVFAGDGGTIYIENSIIAGNTANHSGGALHLGGPGPSHIVNSHIVGNHADGEGGAIGTYNPIHVGITNTLVISNTGITGLDDKYGNSATILLDHCDTYGNSPDGTTGVIITRTNSLGSPPEQGLDPLMAGGELPSGVGPAFASQWLSYDYSLLADSPAIDAGTNDGVAVDKDIDGNPRIVDGTGDGNAVVDMGAYEFLEALLVIVKQGQGLVIGTPGPVHCGSACTAGFLAGTEVTLTATAETGWAFSGWSGDLASADNPVLLTMDSDKAVTTTFGLKTYVITPTAGLGGVITPGTAQTVNYGEDITFTVNANTGSHIVDVLVDGISQGAIARYTFSNVTADHSISAVFALSVPPEITSTDHTTLVVGEAGTFTVTTIGAPTPTIALGGVLPGGVAFADNGDGTGTLSGTLAIGSAGEYPLTLTASNGVAPDAMQAFTLTVNTRVYLPLVLATH